MHAGRYLVGRLLRLTGLSDERHPRNQNVVRLGSEFHADLRFWKWAVNHKLPEVGEAVSTPCYTALERSAKRSTHSTSASKQSAVAVSRRIYTVDMTCRSD